MAWTTPRTWTDGELVTAAIMNPHVRDNLSLVSHFVRKTADESVTSSTTLQNDDHLLYAMSANEVYWFLFGIICNGDTAGDIRVAITVPTSATVTASTVWGNQSGTLQRQQWLTSGTGADLECQGTGVNQYIPISGVAVCAGTAGNLQFQFAQSASSGTPTTVKANSTLWVAKLA